MISSLVAVQAEAAAPVDNSDFNLGSTSPISLTICYAIINKIKIYRSLKIYSKGAKIVAFNTGAYS